MEMPQIDIVWWWMFLCSMAMLNVCAWAFFAARLEYRAADISPEEYRVRQRLLWLAGFYVFGCAFRSVVPVYSVPRLTLVDSWIANAFVDRSIATLAELCFVAQWAVLLNLAARATGSVVARNASHVLLPLIAVAEICSWYSVLTTSNIGHVMEESLWAVSAGLGVASLAAIRPNCAVTWRPLINVVCVLGVVYVAYMLLVDVPMYWSRWLADEAAGRTYLTVARGASDAMTRTVVSFRFEDWKDEIAWMSLYFSVAVWMSLALVHAPMPSHRAAAMRTPPLRLPILPTAGRAADRSR